MARSRYVEQKSQVNQALRAVRRVYRLTDTAGEKLERNLDRLILRKTMVYADQLTDTIALYRDYKGKIDAIELAMTRLVTIAAY